MTPDIEPGKAGWCGSPVYLLANATQPVADGGSACATASAGSLALVAGGEPLTNVVQQMSLPKTQTIRALSAQSVQRLAAAARRGVQLDWFILSSHVSAVQLGGTIYRVRPDRSLPAGLRAVVVFSRGSAQRLTLLDANDKPIASAQANESNVTGLLRSVPLEHVDPRHLPPGGACGLGPAYLASVSSEWETVTARVPRLGDRVEANALFSCARAWYAFARPHVVYSAALLLNAQDPRLRAPQLPGLTPGLRPGDYEEDAATTGQITAKRVGNTWLLVQGPSTPVREQLLAEITANGSEIHTDK